MMKFKKIVVYLSLVSMPSLTLACDSCAKMAIDGGFEALKTQAKLVKESVEALEDSVGSLSDQIKDSSSDVTDSISDFGDSLTDTLTKSNTNLVDAVSSVYVKTSAVFAELGEREKKNLIDVTNELTSAIKSAEKLSRTRKSMFEAGGSFADFKGGEITDSLLALYQSNESYAQKIYAIHAEFIKRWNRRDPAITKNGSTAMLVKNTEKLLSRTDELLSRLQTQVLISSDDYADILNYIAIGLNRSQVSPQSDEYLKIVAHQVDLLTTAVSKAPIIPINSDNLSFFGDMAPQYIEAGGCPETLISLGVLKEDVNCTSMDAILDAVISRTSRPSYLISAAGASKRAILTEVLRNSIVENIAQKRLLDIERRRNVFEDL